MSCDINLTIDTGGPEPATVCEVGSYTSNVCRIWAAALGFPLDDLDGRVAAEAIPDLDRAVARLSDPAHEAAYRALEPSDGWGSLEGATQYLRGLLEACRRHPRATIAIW